jgi:hypothetical protein
MRLAIEIGGSFVFGYALAGLMNGSIKEHVTSEIHKLKMELALKLMPANQNQASQSMSVPAARNVSSIQK